MPTSQNKTARELRAELKRTQDRLAELESTAHAICSGAVDAIVVNGLKGSQIFTIQGPEDPFRIFVGRMNEGAATLTSDGTILFCNQRLAEMMQLAPEVLLGASVSTIVREDQRCRIPSLLQLAQRSNVRTESDLLRQDGTLLPVQLSLSLITFTESEQAICLVATDLSELSQAKRGLREQAEVFELAHDAILIRGLDSRIQSWNRGARDLYGWSAAEAMGKVSFELLHTEFPDSLAAIEVSLRQRKEWEGELRNVCRQGKRIIVASRWSLFRDEQGSPIAVMEINRDITESRKAELELYKSEQAYRTLAESVPQLIWRTDPDGLNIYFNQQWVDYTGLSLAESHGVGWDTPVHPDDKHAVWAAWKQAVETGEIFKFVFRLRAANGVYRWFLSKGLPLRNDQGNILQWLGTCTDIDDLKKSEGEKQLRNQELEARVELRTVEISRINVQLAETIKELEAFAYSVSHDLRAPLRHLDGFLTLLYRRSYFTLDETSRHYIDRTLESSKRMGKLIDDLLQFSRLGRLAINGSTVDLNEIVETILREFNPEVGDRNITWDVGQLPKLPGDQAMLRQVMENLLGNALKFTRHCETAEISIGSQPGNRDEVVIFVRDNGAGFDMQFYQKLFQVFQRLHGEREFEGTGIGLAIVRRVVERHGGRVWAEGAVGAGATFYLSLPSRKLENGTPIERSEANLVS